MRSIEKHKKHLRKRLLFLVLFLGIDNPILPVENAQFRVLKLREPQGV